jgi:hypothetical protein
MMHPPFDHLSKGPVSNQATRDSHPHHCEQLAIFDGVINICAAAKSVSRHSTQWGAPVVFHGQVGAESFADKAAGRRER